MKSHVHLTTHSWLFKLFNISKKIFCRLNESLLLDNKDGVRECLEKQPRDRTEEDIAILMVIRIFSFF